MLKQHPLTLDQASDLALRINMLTVIATAQGSGPGLHVGYVASGVESMFDGISAASWPEQQAVSFCQHGAPRGSWCGRCHEGVRDAASTCPFHDDRAAVRNGMCEPCAEKADDAR